MEDGSGGRMLMMKGWPERFHCFVSLFVCWATSRGNLDLSAVGSKLLIDGCIVECPGDGSHGGCVRLSTGYVITFILGGTRVKSEE